MSRFILGNLTKTGHGSSLRNDFSFYHMKETLVRAFSIMQHSGIVGILCVLILVEIFSIVALNPFPSQVSVDESVVKLSQVKGPQIDNAAASVIQENSLGVCSSLPEDIWIFLLLSYIALLLYNFSYTYTQTHAPQWLWESLYTVLGLVAWNVWDGCRTHLWFPFAVLKTGIIIFAIYVYLLEKKKMKSVREA